MAIQTQFALSVNLRVFSLLGQVLAHITHAQKLGIPAHELSPFLAEA